MDNRLVVVRGGGDLATGTIYRLWKSGFHVLVLETKYPAAIRRQVSVCEAVYQGETIIEDMTAVRVEGIEEIDGIFVQGKIPVFVDPQGHSIQALKPDIVVDAIIAKRNLGTHRGMAPLTIGLGPGFTAGVDVDLVIETKRGHNLGRIITQGMAAANTGIPGNIGGYAKERVIHAKVEGILKNIANIGDVVTAGEEIALIEHAEGTYPVLATIDGILRGLIRDQYPVTVGFKIADIDPRESEADNCFTISDKARCIAGSVLEAVCGYWMAKHR